MVKTRTYMVQLPLSLDVKLSDLAEESGLSKGEITRQAFALYFNAYETVKNEGRVLLETPTEEGKYDALEVKLGR